MCLGRAWECKIEAISPSVQRSPVQLDRPVRMPAGPPWLKAACSAQDPVGAENLVHGVDLRLSPRLWRPAIIASMTFRLST